MNIIQFGVLIQKSWLYICRFTKTFVLSIVNTFLVLGNIFSLLVNGSIYLIHARHSLYPILTNSSSILHPPPSTLTPTLIHHHLFYTLHLHLFHLKNKNVNIPVIRNIHICDARTT